MYKILIFLLLSINSYGQSTRLYERYYQAKEINFTFNEDSIGETHRIDIPIKVTREQDILVLETLDEEHYVILLDRCISSVRDSSISITIYTGTDVSGGDIDLYYIVSSDFKKSAIIAVASSYSVCYYMQ